MCFLSLQRLTFKIINRGLIFFFTFLFCIGLSQWLSSKEFACNADRGDTGDAVHTPGWEDALEKEMRTYSCNLAWRILWAEEPGRLQSMGLQRVRHD